jgi:hypothetical protein
MRNLKLVALSIALLSLGIFAFWQWQRARTLGAEIAGIREQASQDAAVYLRDPGSTATTPSSAALNQEQFRELLRLRGEVQTLSTELAESKRKQATASVSRADPNEPSISLRALEQFNQEAGTKAVFARDWMAAFTEYSSHDQAMFPTNFDQAAEFLSESAKSQTNVTTDQFEIVYHGSRNDFTNEAGWDTIVIRERNAWQKYDGKWGRIYGLAHGAALTRFFDDKIALDQWEAQHIQRQGLQ